jgi:hypothetical protein
MQEQPETKHETGRTEENGEEALHGAIKEPEKLRGRCHQKAKEYCGAIQNWVALLTLIFVAGYTVLTFGLLQETKRSVVVGTRAWVGPKDVFVDAFGPRSEKTNIILEYKNVGKEPARNFNDTYNDDWTATVDDIDHIDISKNCFADDDDGKPSKKTTCKDRINNWLENNCWHKPPYEHRVIYPDFSDTVSKDFKTVDRIAKKKVGFLQGCFIYQSQVTGAEVHRSAFCYFQRFLPDGTKHQMHACPEGNDAN